MMKEIEVDNQKVYLKKDWLGWRVVEPIVLKDVKGEIDWKTFSRKNLFNKRGFITLFFIILILLIGYLAFKEQLTNYNNVMNNPCNYCKTCQDYARGFASDIMLKEKPDYDSNLNFTLDFIK